MTEDDDDVYGIVISRRTLDGRGHISHAGAGTSTIYAALEWFVTTGNTTEILGYYPRTTTWTRKDIYYDTREAEEMHRD
jgi:hypothetical protein